MDGFNTLFLTKSFSDRFLLLASQDAIYEFDGTAWTERNVTGAFNGAWSVYAADVDGDGDLDVLGAALDADDIIWWENTTGDGIAWTEHTVNGVYDGASSVHAADIDGDGDMDVLGAAYNADEITWWESDCITDR